MRLDDAILQVMKDAGRRMTVDEVYEAVYKLAENDDEVLEDWLAQDQETLRKDARSEAAERKRYIAKESKRRKK